LAAENVPARSNCTFILDGANRNLNFRYGRFGKSATLDLPFRLTLTSAISLLPIAFAGVSSVCAVIGTGIQVPSNERKLASGLWGTDHLSLEIFEARAEFEFDCAHGSIDSPFMLESDGSFKLKGTYTRETHGPIRIGNPLQSRQAEYFGHVDGNNMRLSVRLIGGNDEVENYLLQLGKQGRIWKCK